MQLSDDKIKLSPLHKADLEFFLAILTCSEIMEHISKPLSHEEAKSAFEVRSQPWDVKSNGWLTLPISDLTRDEKVGWVSFRVVDHLAKKAEVGFILKSEFQGKGIANRAMKLLKEFAFYELNMNKLVAFCSVHNPGSYKLLEKLSFVREGCFAQNNLINNQYVDAYAYGLCKSDV